MRLIEDLNSAYNYYKDKIDRDTFNRLISLDPTFDRSQNKLGTYGKWILARYLDPNSDVSENEGHVKDILTRFDKEKSKLINKDIMSYKSMADLDMALADDDSYADLSHRQEVRQRQNARRNADVDKDLVYENGKVKIYSPSSYANSCKLGEGTTWCTASTEYDYYYNYYKDTYGGKYFILISANSDEKYQFHIESWQFMDKEDRPINPYKVSKKLGCEKWFERQFYISVGISDINVTLDSDIVDEYLSNWYLDTAQYLTEKELTRVDCLEYASREGINRLRWWQDFDPTEFEWTQEAEDALASIGSSVEIAKEVYRFGNSRDDLYPEFGKEVVEATDKIVHRALAVALAKAQLEAIREGAKHLGNDRMSITPAGGHQLNVKISLALVWELGQKYGSFWEQEYWFDYSSEDDVSAIIIAKCLYMVTDKAKFPEGPQPSIEDFCEEIAYPEKDD